MDRVTAGIGVVFEEDDDLGVFDFETPDHSMRLLSVHPGVSVQDVLENTGFDLAHEDQVPETRLPSEEELGLIRDFLDPKGMINREIPS